MRTPSRSLLLALLWLGHGVTTGSRGEAPLTSLAQQAERPRRQVNVSLEKLQGREFIVRRGQNLQRVIDRARRGDTIRVDATGEWPAIVLPEKPGTGWIHIESMQMPSLPDSGERVEMRHASSMPTILNITSGTPRPALNTELSASHYRIMGLHLKSRPYRDSGHNKMFMLGRGRSTMMEAKRPDDLPHHIIVDRCIIEGWPGNTTRGMYLDGTDIAVVGCQIVDITANSESIGILVTNTPGPILIENNAIGASGVNIFIGDNSPLRWSGVNAADITIRRNLIYKKPEWKSTNALKNHFEMKRGERVLFEDNDCVYSPVDAQTGFSIKLKTGGHDQYVADVTIAGNRIRQVNGYLAISNQSSAYTVRRVLSQDNQIRGLFPGSTAIAFAVPPPAAMVGDIAFLRDDLRGTSVKSFMALASRQPSVQRLECRELQTEHGEYGIKGDGTQTGTNSLDTYCEQYSLSGNALFGQAFANRKDWYPPGNRHLPRRPERETPREPRQPLPNDRPASER